MLPGLCASFGRHLLLVTGKGTVRRSPALQELLDKASLRGSRVSTVVVDREPSPDLVDRTVTRFHDDVVDVVVSIGGGSALDAGKAISAMLLQRHSVERFIEGQEGCIAHDGRKVPFIAVPTTSGTGSEVTSNAVISRVGPGGYKRSFRHAALVPDAVIIDPELMTTVPRSLTAASGMDTCTQLLEAFSSPFANAYTDAVAASGLEHFSRSFMAACSCGSGDVAVRGDVAYASLMSGIALANAGLGIVHGFASSIGGLFDIPHGTLCATLLAESTRENIRQLRLLDPAHPQLVKYASAGRILAGGKGPEESVTAGCARLLDTLAGWQESLGFPRLGVFGVREGDIEPIISITRSKSNAVNLDQAALRRIIASRL